MWKPHLWTGALVLGRAQSEEVSCGLRVHHVRHWALEPHVSGGGETDVSFNVLRIQLCVRIVYTS